VRPLHIEHEPEHRVRECPATDPTRCLAQHWQRCHFCWLNSGVLTPTNGQIRGKWVCRPHEDLA
jgi:hypothetical protein